MKSKMLMWATTMCVVVLTACSSAEEKPVVADVQTQDMKFADVKGKVKSCTLITCDNNSITYEFSENGKLTSLSDVYTSSYFLQYDKKGRIMKAMNACVGKFGDVNNLTSTYEYDEEGNIVKQYCEESWDKFKWYRRLYTYKDGRVAECNECELNTDTNSEYTYKVTYLEFDKQGNWTKRKCVKYKSDEEVDKDLGEEKRVIVYY